MGSIIQNDTIFLNPFNSQKNMTVYMQIPNSRYQGTILSLTFIQYSMPCLHLFLLLLLVSLTGCREETQPYFQGYIEGEFLLISSPLAGKLEVLSVSRGEQVNTATQLFTLEQALEQAAVVEAEQGVRRSENRLADISKGLRPSELAALEAQLKQAEAAYDLSVIELERRQKLLETKVIAKEVLDRTRTELERNSAVVSQIKAELETARLGARPDEIEAARAELSASRSKLSQAKWKVEQKAQFAPESGLVFDTFYVTGEFVPAGYPVVSLLPPGNVKIRFFVSEKKISTLSTGQKVWFSLDGTQKINAAEITYISPRAEYTPPVIYSRESRSKLVFMIEAKISPKDAMDLHPGQPVDVSLEMPDA